MQEPHGSRDTRLVRLLTLGAPALAGGCSGVQSTFSAFGEQAETIRTLTWVMVSAGTLIYIGVLALAVIAVHSRRRLGFSAGMYLVLWCGGIFPSIALAALLVTSLPKMKPLAADDGALAIAVDAEQFWWRVRYETPAGPVETANEIRLPVGRTVVFTLGSADVIHSFWIPGLAGKLDMFPGRTHELVARATRTGIYRGACAEFCGLSHALMAFDVAALEGGEFDGWLAALARPAAEVAGAGRALFAEYGCQGCHVVRGHFEQSGIGPDLTHIGSRLSLAAGALPMTRDALARFIRNPAAIKAGTRMPAFPRMPAEDAAAIAAYLEALR